MKITTIVDRLVADLGDKRRWRTYRARARALPGPYRTTTEALERYLLHAGGVAKGDRLGRCSRIWPRPHLERAAADRTPVWSIVGDDPVAFAEDFLSNYADGQWVNRGVSACTAAGIAAEKAGDPHETQHERPAGQRPAISDPCDEKSFADNHVLRGVDLEVAKGSIVALLGPNGAGKTTLVRILATLLEADAGTATVNGFDVATLARDVRASISLTGQFAAVDEVLTARRTSRSWRRSAT